MSLSVQESQNHTVRELLHAYRQEYLPTKAASTQYSQGLYFIRLQNMTVDGTNALGDLSLADLTPPLLRRWRDMLMQEYAVCTVRRYLYALSAPLTVAVRDYEWLKSNPLTKVKFPPMPEGRMRFLSDE